MKDVVRKVEGKETCRRGGVRGEQVKGDGAGVRKVSRERKGTNGCGLREDGNEAEQKDGREGRDREKGGRRG